MKHQRQSLMLVCFIFAALSLPSSAQNIHFAGDQHLRSAGIIANLGMDVQGPKLLKKVDAIYPQTARIDGTYGEVIIEILINEQGHVGGTTIRSGNPVLSDAVIAAVKQWVFAPTLLDGRSVQAKATAVFVFNLYSTPRSLDMRRTGIPVYITTGPDSERLVMNQEGKLIRAGGATLSPTEIRDIQQRFKPFTLRFDITTANTVPFAVIDRTLRSLEVEQVFPFRLESPEYRFYRAIQPYITSSTEPRLFYSILLSDESDLIQLVGPDSRVIPPVLNIDFTRLAQVIPAGSEVPRIYFCTMFVDEQGTILAVESLDEETKDAVTILKQVQVRAPGRRENENVPTAILVAIPKK